MNDFLKETEFCDFSNQRIKELANELSKNCKNEKEIAISVFYWVRDNILYRVGLWQRKASETLTEKEGTCTNKVNLLVALLRANNIPAGYGVMKVYGQRYLGEIVIPALKKFIGEISTHIYAVVYLNRKWIKCDPSNDKKFCENTSYFNSTAQLIEWDGIKDAPLNIKKENILKDEYPIANIDSYMRKKPKNAKGIQLKVANIFIKFARQNTKKVANVEEYEYLFKKYLKINHPIYFFLFGIISIYKSFELKFRKWKGF